MPEYEAYKEAKNSLEEQIKKYAHTIGSIIKKIKNWNANDPVSLLYSKLFTGDVVVDLPSDEAKIMSELEYHNKHDIPPGYRDKDKPDQGMGVYLMWLRILH